MLYVRCVWSPKRRTDDTSSEARDNLDGEEKHNDDVEWAVAGLSGLYCLQRLRSLV